MSKKSNNPADDEQYFAQALEAKHAQLMANADSDQVIADEEDQRVQSAMMVLQLLEEFNLPQESPGVATDETVDDPLTKPSLREPSSETTAEKALPDLERLGRFEIIEQVGRGGFGIVVRAHDPQLGRDVAIKIPRFEAALSPQSRQRFEREAKAAAALNHPNIVGVLESGSEQGIDFIVTEFVDGENLATRLAKGEELSANDAAELVASIADAMEHAHQRGILHRDLKPSNILLRDNELHSPLIADFGLATVTDEIDFTQTGAVIGTPAYMSPEQAAGNKQAIGPTTDVYGLGTILYQLLTGRSPYADLPLVEILDAIHRRDPESPRSINGQVPKDLESICLKCLEKNPDRRYSSAQELQADLQRFLAGQSVVARRIRTPEKTIRWFQRNPLVGSISAGLAVVVLVALITMTWLWQRSETNRIIAEQNKQQYLRKSDQLTEAVNRLFVSLANNPEIRESSADGLRRTLLVEANTFQVVFLSEAPDDPELIRDYARLLFSLAEINTLLGDLEKGRELTAAALKQADRLEGDFAIGNRELADWHTLTGRTLTLQGEFELAGKAFAAAVDTFSESAKPDDPDWLTARASMLTQQAYSLAFQEKLDEAMLKAKAAIDLWKMYNEMTVPLPNDPFHNCDLQQAMSHFVLAEAQKLHGKFTVAIDSYKTSLDLYDGAKGHIPESTATRYNRAKALLGMGIAQAESRLFDEAANSYRLSLQMIDQIAKDHPLVESYVSLASRVRYSFAATEYMRKNYEPATEMIKQNITEKKSLVVNFSDSGAKHLSSLGDSYNLQYVILAASQSLTEDEAKAILNRAIDAFDASIDANPEWARPKMAVCRTIMNLGNVNQKYKKFDDAMIAYDDGRKRLNAILEIKPKWYEAVDAYYVTTRNMVFCQLNAGNRDDAVELIDALIERFPNHRRNNSTILLKPRVYVELGRIDDALDTISSVGKIRAKSSGNFIMAAKTAIDVSQLDELVDDPETKNQFVDLAVEILQQGRPANEAGRNAYIQQIQNTPALKDLADQIESP